MPHLLLHGTCIYNGHLQGPMTVTPIADRLAVELSLPVLTTLVCRGWDSNIQPSDCEANANKLKKVISNTGLLGTRYTRILVKLLVKLGIC